MMNVRGVNYIQNVLVEELLLLVRAAVSITLWSGLALYRDKICYHSASCTTVLCVLTIRLFKNNSVYLL
jgi:hypothetical protein